MFLKGSHTHMIRELKEQTKFTETEKEIAVYVLRREDEIIPMSIREFSDACNASPTAVMRFCRKLGCDGFKDFKIKLLKELEKPAEPAVTDVNRPFYIGYSTQKIARTIYKLQEESMKECMEDLDIPSIEKAARILTNARVVFMYGYGDSLILARSFMNRLYKINKMCILATESSEEAGMSNNATEKDAAVFITYRGGNEKFSKCADTLKQQKCPVIVLSADFETPLTEKADISIRVKDKENSSDNIATFYSQAVFGYILNVLYSLIYSAMYTKNHSHKKKIDEYTKLK